MYVTLAQAQTAVLSDPHTMSHNATSNLNRPARRLAIGANVYREGDEATHIYEVKTGILRLTRVLANGRRQVISFALPGDVIGFPNGKNHHTDCDVLESCEVTIHPRAALDAGARDPETQQRLLKAALREISAMQDHFMMLARKSALEKVASFLMVLADRIGTPHGNHISIDLAMKRADIADFLGLTIETVSRTITQLRASAIIALHSAQTVIILDPAALAEAAETD
jgi:CRP-like cAMP-binding protein